MATFRHGTAGPDFDSTATLLKARRVASALGAVAALSLLTACNFGQDNSNAPRSAAGVAQSTSGGNSSASLSSSPEDSGSTPTSGSTRASGNGTPSAPCVPSQLRGHVGENNPGAGQENFPLIVTNFSQSTCWIKGYPTVAYMNDSGQKVGPNPVHGPGGPTPTKIMLNPGKSAWAGLSFGNPETSGADKATPTGLRVAVPFDSRTLGMDWTGGPVPVSEPSTLTAFQPGTGPS